MQDSLLIKLAVVILFLPLIGFIVTVFFGKSVKKVYVFENLVLIASFILASILLYGKLNYYIDTDLFSEFEWINLGEVPLLGLISIKLGLMLDNVAAIMIWTVMLISLVVHIF